MAAMHKTLNIPFLKSPLVPSPHLYSSPKDTQASASSPLEYKLP